MSEPELREGPRRPWPRRLARPLLWVLLVVALLSAALVVLYRSPWAAERVRLLVEARMSEYLDRDVDVGRVEYGLRPGSFVLYDLVIPSPDPDDPPFAVVPRTEVRFALSGFTRLTLDIVRVEVDRPEVHVLFHADGTNNLPELQRPRREGPGRVEVVIGHLVVEGGTLHFDQRAMPLEIDAQAVRASVEGAGEAPGGGDRFLAVAAAQEVRIVLPDARPWHGALAARGSFVPGRVDVTGGWARGPGLAARFEGFYGWNEEQRHGIVEVEARGDAALARRLGYVEEAIDGPFGFAGRVTIDERDISYAGNVTSERLEYGRRAFTGVVAEIAGDADALVVDVDRAGHAGGTVAGVVRVDLSGGGPEAGRAVEIDGDFDDLAIEALLADLDLDTDLLSRLTGRASGDLAYRFSTAAPLAGSGEATVRVAAVRGATEDLPLSGRAELAIEDGVLSSDDVDLAAPGQRLAASGRWDLEERAGRFDFRLATEDPGRLLRALPPIEVSDPPPGWFPTAGRGTVEGTVAVAGEEVELEATVDLTGVVTPTLELARLRAPVVLRDGVLVVTDLLAAGPEQRLTASGRWDLDAERGRFDFRLATGDAGDLLRTVPAIEIGDPPPDWFPLEGSGTAAGRLEIAGGEVAVVADVELRDVVTPRLELTRLAAPVEYRNGVVSTTGLVAVGPEQRLTASGRYDVAGERGGFELALVSEDLGEIAALVPREPGAPPPPWLPTAGRGTVEGTLTVAPGPELTGRAVFDLAAVDTPSGRWDTLAGSLRLTPGAIRDLRLEATADGGALVAAGDVPFPLDAGDLELSVSVVDFPVERLAGLVPQIPETTGRVTARIDAVGAFDRLQGQATVELGAVTIAGIELSGLEGTVAFRGERLVVDRLVAETPAGTISGVGTWNRATGSLAFQVTGDDLLLDRPPFAERVPGELAGVVDVLATVEGTVERPRVAAEIAARDLALAGQPLGDEGDARVVALWDGDSVTARGSLLGLVSFDGGGALTMERADLAFQVASDDLGPIVQLFSPEPVLDDLSGAFAGALTVRGPLDGWATPEVALTLPLFTVTYEGRRIESLEPVALRLADGALVVDSLFLGTAADGDDELFVAGTVGLTGERPLDLNLQADVDVAWIELLVPNLQLEGDVEALAVVRGTAADPRFSGQAALVDGEMLIAGFPHAFEELQAVALLYPDRVVLDHARAEVAGGDLRAAGEIGLIDVTAGVFDYRLQAEVTDVAVRFPEGFLLRGDANLVLTSEEDGRLLAGAVDLDRAFYVEDVPAGIGDLLFTVFEPARLEVAEADEELAGTQLNVAISGPDALRVSNNVANLEGDVDLVLRGSLARPVVLGQVEIEPGGDVVYADNEYEVERGLLTFANPRRIDPVIDVVATTEVRSFDVTLNLAGTVDRLNATFTSDPPLADLEIVSLLTTGQQIADSGRIFAGQPSGTPGAPGAAAQQFLYGQAASVISERVNTLFGFDRFRVAPVAAGVGQGSLAFTVGKQISRDLFVTYSRDPATSDLDVLQVEWQAEENVIVVLTQRGDGSYAIDVQVERRF